MRSFACCFIHPRNLIHFASIEWWIRCSRGMMFERLMALVVLSFAFWKIFGVSYTPYTYKHTHTVLSKWNWYLALFKRGFRSFFFFISSLLLWTLNLGYSCFLLLVTIITISNGERPAEWEYFGSVCVNLRNFPFEIHAYVQYNCSDGLFFSTRALSKFHIPLVFVFCTCASINSLCALKKRHQISCDLPSIHCCLCLCLVFAHFAYEHIQTTYTTFFSLNYFSRSP